MRFKAGRLLLTFLLLLSLTLSAGATQGKEGSVVIPSGASTNGPNPGYTPSTITVVIGVNNTVIWLNNDTVHHTVTPSALPAGGNWSVGSGDMAPGKTYQFTFTVPGKYTYVCAYHSFMHGTVIVKAGSTVPEFPPSSLAAVLFFTVTTAALLLRRVGPKTPLLGSG